MRRKQVSGSAHPPRVLVANPSADLYGSDRMMLESVSGLAGSGWKVVVTSSDSGPLIGPLQAAGAEIRLRSVPVVRKAMMTPGGLVRLGWSAVTSLPRMLRLLREERPDVVLVNTLTIPLWLVAARLSRVPAVVHVHEAERSVATWARLALAAPLVLAHLVIYNSEVSREVSGLRIMERRRRVRVIHNGIRGPQHSSAARSTLEPPFALVYVGRLSPRKGVDLVLRAASALGEQGISCRVDLVGSVFAGYEWYEEGLRQLVDDLGLHASVHFHGFQESVWPYLAAADVAVVPSRLDESFGNSLVEAVLAGRPVVASDHTGLREAAADLGAAHLVTTDDVDALTTGLRRIHDEWADYRRLADEESRTARESHGPARFHRELADALATVISTRGPSRRTIQS